jgi:hypothetical protein
VLALPHLLSILQVSVWSSKCNWALFTVTAGNLSCMLSVLEYTIWWFLFFRCGTLYVFWVICFWYHCGLWVIQACICGITQEWGTAIVVFWLGGCSLPKCSPVCHQGMEHVFDLSQWPTRCTFEGHINSFQRSSLSGWFRLRLFYEGMPDYWSVPSTQGSAMPQTLPSTICFLRCLISNCV